MGPIGSNETSYPRRWATPRAHASNCSRAPLKAMVAMAHTSGGQALETNVVLRIRRRHYNATEATQTEQSFFEGRQPAFVDVLDHFDGTRRVEAAQPFVAIGDRALKETDPLALVVRHLVPADSILGHFQGVHRYIHAPDPLQASVTDQPFEQLPFATPDIDDPTGQVVLKRLMHGLQPTLVQRQRFFEPFFPVGRSLVALGDILLLWPLVAEPSERVARQASTALEVSKRDRFALGVLRKPSFPASQQFVDLVRTDPVVFVVVEHRYDDRQMPKQLGQRHGVLDGHRRVRTVTPLSKVRIERMSLDAHRVSERFEQRAHERLPATAKRQNPRSGPAAESAYPRAYPAPGSARRAPSRVRAKWPRTERTMRRTGDRSCIGSARTLRFRDSCEQAPRGRLREATQACNALRRPPGKRCAHARTTARPFEDGQDSSRRGSRGPSRADGSS